MKNFKKIILIISFSIVLIIACKKVSNNPIINNALNSKFSQSIVIPYNPSITKESDYLKFPNVATFESTLIILDSLNDSCQNVWENYYAGFTSMRKHYQIAENLQFNQDIVLNPEYDESVGTTINIDGLIRIDSTAFLLDHSDNSIYEVYPVNTATIALLKQKNEINNDTMYIFKYSMNNEVLHPAGYEEARKLKMVNGSEVVNNNKRGLGKWLKKIFTKCTEDGINPDPDDDNNIYTDMNNSTIQYKYEYDLKYRSSGVSYALMYKVKHYKKTGENGGWKTSNGEACFSGNSQWKKRCDNYGGKSSTCIPNRTYSSTKVKEIIYREGSKLTRLKSTGYFYMTRMDGYIPKTIYSRLMQVAENPHISW